MLDCGSSCTTFCRRIGKAAKTRLAPTNNTDLEIPMLEPVRNAEQPDAVARPACARWWSIGAWAEWFRHLVRPEPPAMPEPEAEEPGESGPPPQIAGFEDLVEKGRGATGR